MINLFPFKLWSTTVYNDFGTSQDQCSYSQKEAIYHAHTSGICVMIAILDPSTEADEDYLNYYYYSMPDYAGNTTYNATENVNHMIDRKLCFTGLSKVRIGHSEWNSSNFGAR